MKVNKKVIRRCVLAVILLPILISVLISWNLIPNFQTDNDWLGFFGSYIGGIVGGVIGIASAVYVLHETQKENRKAQERAEIIQFCDYLVKTSSTFAYRYESKQQQFVEYREMEKRETISADDKFDLYKETIKLHNDEKVVLYELVMNLEIRSNIPVFCTPSFKELMDKCDVVYEYAFKFGANIDKIDKEQFEKNWNDMNELLVLLKKYEEELLKVNYI